MTQGIHLYKSIDKYNSKDDGDKVITSLTLTLTLTQKTDLGDIKPEDVKAIYVNISGIITSHISNYLSFPNCEILDLSGMTTTSVLNMNVFSGLLNVHTLLFPENVLLTIKKHAINDINSLKSLTINKKVIIETDGIVSATSLQEIIIKSDSVSNLKNNCILTCSNVLKMIDMSESSISPNNVFDYFNGISSTGVLIAHTSVTNASSIKNINDWFVVHSSAIKRINQSNGSYDVFYYNNSDILYKPSKADYNNRYINKKTGTKQVVFINEFINMLKDSFMGTEINRLLTSVHLLYNDDKISKNFSDLTISNTSSDIANDFFGASKKVVVSIQLIFNTDIIELHPMLYSFIKAVTDSQNFHIDSGKTVIINMNNTDLNFLKTVISNGEKIYFKILKDIYSTGASITTTKTIESDAIYQDYKTLLNNTSYTLKRVKIAQKVDFSGHNPEGYYINLMDNSKYYPVSFSYWSYYDGRKELINPIATPRTKKVLPSDISFYNDAEEIMEIMKDGNIITRYSKDALMTGYYNYHDSYNYYYYEYLKNDIDFVCVDGVLYNCLYMYKSTLPNYPSDMELGTRIKQLSMYKFYNNVMTPVEIIDYDYTTRTITFKMGDGSNKTMTGATEFSVLQSIEEIRYDGSYRTCLQYIFTFKKYLNAKMKFIKNKNSNLAVINDLRTDTLDVIMNRYNVNYQKPIVYAIKQKTGDIKKCHNIYSLFLEKEYAFIKYKSVTTHKMGQFFGECAFPTNNTVYIFDICGYNYKHPYINQSSKIYRLFMSYNSSTNPQYFLFTGIDMKYYTMTDTTKHYCPNCSSDSEPVEMSSSYNTTTGLIDYTCPTCGKKYSEHATASKYEFSIFYKSVYNNDSSKYSSYKVSCDSYGDGAYYRIVMSLNCVYLFAKIYEDNVWTLVDSLSSKSENAEKILNANFINNYYDDKDVIYLFNSHNSYKSTTPMYHRILVCEIEPELQFNTNNFKYDSINIGKKTRDVKPYYAEYDNGFEKTSMSVLYDSIHSEYITDFNDSSSNIISCENIDE